ncbi:hypothetical protein GCM10010965_30830 [Caldalkalibacillus thermarum]|uniref:cell wall-binding repeat-containing protein n=1 Tax=Caldalkalibacillus thermarum TaxID=296745 RepID=UPI00166EA753|nr:cell wall-binding repeat-containing protein [Caldalkalibacillus thermarum]GGK35699.1 hypothetical protein GCM10010965_30830 [Caldalkalibacillus thermarum]
MFFKNRHVSVIVTLFLVFILVFTPALETLAGTHVSGEPDRLAGQNRYETAVEISKAGWPDGAETVILATGERFPDALAGTTLAYKYDAPILLTRGKELTDVTKKEIQRLKAKKVIILGGESAVSKQVENALKNIQLEVERIYGNTRYETAVKIAERLGYDKETVIIASGQNFPDALAVAPYAAKEGIPILLTQRDKLPTETKEPLKGVRQTYVIGGTQAVGEEVFVELPNAKRIFGQNRYETAVKIIEEFGLDTSKSFVATGEDFADALTGAALAAKEGSPILLVAKERVPEHVQPLLETIREAIILGGPGAVGQKVAEQLRPDHTLPPKDDPDGELLYGHFIDVGQGDATLLQGPDFTVLIDAGRHDRNDVVPYLQSVGVESIDLLVLTHPHADHIGQADKVLNTFEVTEVWMSGDEHTSLTFERVIDAIAESGANYNEPRAGEVYEIGSLTIEVVNPDELTGDFHEGSISLRAIYGDIKFLFTGDAEAQTEKAMIERGHDLKAHIFQAGHHGSSTSNTQEFLEAVQPEIIIYSAGKDNPYGHPHKEVVQRILDMGIALYGTDVHGTVIVETDGKTYEINTEVGGEIEIPVECIDINSASFEELQQIVHIGPERAQQIIELRPFYSLDDLLRVDGIGPSRLQDIKDQGLACVHPPEEDETN